MCEAGIRERRRIDAVRAADAAIPLCKDALGWKPMDTTDPAWTTLELTLQQFNGRAAQSSRAKDDRHRRVGRRRTTPRKGPEDLSDAVSAGLSSGARPGSSGQIPSNGQWQALPLMPDNARSQ